MISTARYCFPAKLSESKHASTNIHRQPNCAFFYVRSNNSLIRRFQLNAKSTGDGATNKEIPENRLFSEEEEVSSSDACIPFRDRDGNLVEVMCCDYGFRSKDRMYGDEFGKIPENLGQLAIQNFKYEFNELRSAFRQDTFKGISEQNPATGPIGRASYWIGSQIVSFFSSIDKQLEENEILSKLKLPEIPPLKIFDSVDASEPTSVVAVSDGVCLELRGKLGKLKLSNDAVWDRERARIKQGFKVEAPWYINLAYYSLCYLLDVLFNNRPLQRFWFLETVARMPYFSYISMLHLYESLGWWRQGSILRKIHFAEEWNELHHLQIMESLGGDQYWIDRFTGQHAAVFYYWILLLFYVFSPRLAYNFSELIEAHAVDTYGEFVDANEELLQEIPPPYVAVQYYRGDDLYMFDEFQTSPTDKPRRRPNCNNLYDVFCNIRDDENEHVKTMKGCQDETIVQDLEFQGQMKKQNT